MNLASVNRNLGAGLEKGVFSVVKAAETILVAVIRKFCANPISTTVQIETNWVQRTMVIPGGNPGEVLGQKLQIRVASVLFCVSMKFP